MANTFKVEFILDASLKLHCESIPAGSIEEARKKLLITYPDAQICAIKSVK